MYTPSSSCCMLQMFLSAVLLCECSLARSPANWRQQYLWLLWENSFVELSSFGCSQGCLARLQGKAE